MARKTVKGGKTPSFETRMRRLEDIVQDLEDGNNSLDEVVSMYEEGIRIARECMEYLDKTEIRLRKLGRDAEDNLTVTDVQEAE